jgi:hypothetical protein
MLAKCYNFSLNHRRAIVINCLPLRESQSDGGGAPGASAAAIGSSTAESMPAAASHGGGRNVVNDSSEQRFRLMKQLSEIVVRVRRWRCMPNSTT